MHCFLFSFFQVPLALQMCPDDVSPAVIFTNINIIIIIYYKQVDPHGAVESHRVLQTVL